MKTSEVLNAWTTPNNFCEPRNDYYFNLTSDSDILTKERAHEQKFLMSLGRKLPGTKAHAKFWITNGCVFDVISTHDIKPFSSFCEKIGFTPDFTFTKSKIFVRLTSTEGFSEAIKKYYEI